ncbi:hypothetical protein IG631_13714 [Alternaria alternata]|nr:hypothetical protein IG631_13714 [Alternaria alternata]
MAITMLEAIGFRRNIPVSSSHRSHPHFRVHCLHRVLKTIPDYLRSVQLCIMCILFHYAYQCHPPLSETLLLPCRFHLFLPSEGERQFLDDPKDPAICPRLWEKKVSSPHCIECLARLSRCGMALRESEKENT